MALIKISGVEIPTPSDYSVGIQDINKVERNARADMIGERIATKRKIELSWKTLTPSQLSIVLNLVAPLFFSVEYLDPMTNGVKVGTFYAGDRNCSMLSFVNGAPKYRDLKFNIIER